MALTKSTFKVLNALRDEAVHTQRHIATVTGLSLGTVNTAYRALVDAGLTEGFRLTPQGYTALAPYKVDNAIIMAAGVSARFAPLSYEKPKGLFEVRGEVLIERQIRQLKEAGITDITVVVGYMKEAFFYLEDKFGVTIRVNAEYSVRNNNSTLMLVREKLGNTYVCSSDDYFTENVFEPYVFEAYYPGVFFAGETNEYLLDTARDGRITGVTIGGRDKYGMLGHVYFDRAFSETFVRILVDEYDWPETAGKLWEDIYRAHLDELRMVMRPYEPGVICEFDSISDLKEFDHDFIENVDSAILDNICRVLDCSRGDVEGIVPIKEGLTNLSFRFVVRGESYVYRHPGVGTDEIINRASRPLRRSSASTTPSSTRTPPKAGRSRASSTAAFPSTTTTRTTCAMRWSWVAACMTAARKASGPSTCTATRSQSWSFSAGRATRRFPIVRSSGATLGCSMRSCARTASSRVCATTTSTARTSSCAATRCISSIGSIRRCRLTLPTWARSFAAPLTRSTRRAM